MTKKLYLSRMFVVKGEPFIRYLLGWRVVEAVPDFRELSDGARQRRKALNWRRSSFSEIIVGKSGNSRYRINKCAE